MNRNLTILVGSSIISGIGTGVALLGIPWAIYMESESSSLVSYYLICAYISLFILLPKFSSLIDRVPRKLSASIIYLIGFLIQSTIAYISLTEIHLTLLILSGSISVVLRSLDQVNRLALAQELSQSSEYHAINVYLEISRQIVTILAGVAAATLIESGGIVLVLGLDAGTYLLSALVITQISSVKNSRLSDQKNSGIVDNHDVSSFRSAIKIAQTNGSTFRYLIATLAPLVAVVAQNALYPAHFQIFLMASTSEYALHAFVYGAGALLASVNSGRPNVRGTLLERKNQSPVLIFFYLMAIISSAFIQSTMITYLAIFVFAWCAAKIRIERNILIMSLYPQSIIGRVNGFFEMISVSFIVITLLFSGYLADAYGVQYGWIPFGVMILASSLYVLLEPIGHSAESTTDKKI